MTAKDDIGAMGLDRLNALFAWWGIPDAGENGNVDGQMKRFQAFTSDLQKVYGEAYNRQMEAMFTANERIAKSLQAFLHCREARDVIAAESNVLATILEGASLQSRTWVEVTQKIQDCCASMARESADAAREHVADENAPAKPAPTHAKGTSK